MFYCDDCRKKKGWPEGIMHSRGPCDVCGKAGICNSVPSNVLPMPKQATVPCKRCSKPTTKLRTKLCDCCWEVESRLEKYLESEKAREHVHSLICKHRYVAVEEL